MFCSRKFRKLKKYNVQNFLFAKNFLTWKISKKKSVQEKIFLMEKQNKKFSVEENFLSSKSSIKNLMLEIISKIQKLV